MTTIIGIDYSGAKSDLNTWVAQGRLTSDGALVFDSAQMRRRNDVTELLATTSTPAVAGIDFPFGVPLEFADFLNTSKGLRSLPEAWRIVSDLRLEDFNAARDAFVDRFGEPKRAGDASHFSESFSPLHKVNPNMIPMTYYGMQMMHELSKKQSRALVCAPIAGVERCISDRGYTSGNDAGRFSEGYRHHLQGIQEAKITSTSRRAPKPHPRRPIL